MPKTPSKKPNYTVFLLNAALVVVIVLLCVFSYIYISSPLPEPVSTANTPADTTVPETLLTEPPTSAEPPETTHPPMTHASTEVDLSEETETAETSKSETEFVPGEYDGEFFARTLFIGDSIFTGLSGYGFIPASNVFAEKGLAPSAALTYKINGSDVFERAKGFDRAVIMLGTNALGNNASSLAADMKTLVSRIKDSSPGIETVVLTVTPVAAVSDYSVTIDMVNNYNAALAEAASDNSFLLIDVCSDFKGSDGFIKDDYVQPDGLHLTQKGYKELLSIVEFKLK